MTGKGILYGVGTGPGDPELLTLKAIRIIKEADVIAVPNEIPENSIPYRTVAAVYPELASKEILPVPFLTEPDQEARQAVREENADRIAAILDQGRSVAFLTIGDPSIYTTYSYVFAILAPRGYTCEMISGVPSFCGASARLNTTLCGGNERLEIIPGGMGGDAGSTQIYMKYESRFPELIRELKARGEKPMVIENCCLEGERAFPDADHLPEDIGYFNIVISRSRDTER